jgi:Tfp pilus assembly pilus retraction ATPase PilT
MEASKDLDQIVRELNDASEARKKELDGALQLDKWLERLLAEGGSDLLLVPGAPASMLMQGSVKHFDNVPLEGAEIEEVVLPALTSRALTQFREHQISDSSYRIAGKGRFRINLHRERGQPAASIRALPPKVPMLADLKLPPQVEALSHLKRGLVLIGGPAGSGKSTTCAALINEINRR